MQTQTSRSSNATVYSPPAPYELALEAERLYRFYVLPSNETAFRVVIGAGPTRLTRTEEAMWLNFARKNLYKTFLQAQQERQQCKSQLKK